MLVYLLTNTTLLIYYEVVVSQAGKAVQNAIYKATVK